MLINAGILFLSYLYIAVFMRVTDIYCTAVIEM